MCLIFTISEVNSQQALLAIIDKFIVTNKPFPFKHSRYFGFYPGARDVDTIESRLSGIADPRQHIRYRIAHRHISLRFIVNNDNSLTLLEPAKIYDPPAYQLDLITPGSLPWDARVRKQIRHIPNLRIYPRGRPQIGQRL
jgi:hypothetical protein